MARRPMPWQEELFNSLSTGNIESAKTTVQQHNVNVGGKIFFSGVTYDKRLHSAPFYYAQGTVRNALGLVLGLLAFAYVMAGALVCLFFITGAWHRGVGVTTARVTVSVACAGDFEFANAPGWLRVPTILVFLVRAVAGTTAAAALSSRAMPDRRTHTHTQRHCAACPCVAGRCVLATCTGQVCVCVNLAHAACCSHRSWASCMRPRPQQAGRNVHARGCVGGAPPDGARTADAVPRSHRRGGCRGEAAP